MSGVKAVVGPCELRFTYLGGSRTCQMTLYKRDGDMFKDRRLCVLKATDDLNLFHAFGQAALVAAVIIENSLSIPARNITFALDKGSRMELCRFSNDAWGSTEFLPKRWEQGSTKVSDVSNWQ